MERLFNLPLVRFLTVSLAGIMFLVVLPAAFFIHRAEPERRAVFRFQQLQAGFYYDYHTGGICERAGRPHVPDFAIRAMGLHVFHHVTGIGLTNDRIRDADVRCLFDLPKLKWAIISSSAVTDASVSVLERLSSLESMQLHETGISPEGVSRLRRALPHCRIDVR